MRTFFWAVSFLGILSLSLHGAVRAVETAAIAGNDYEVRIRPEEDAGAYCEEQEIRKDAFHFDYNGEFFVEGLDLSVDLQGGQLAWLHDYFGEQEELGGTFSEDGISFEAAFNALDEDYNYYKLTVQGRRYANLIIAGSMNIKYYEPVWATLIIFDYIDRWELKDDSDARFIGFKD